MDIAASGYLMEIHDPQLAIHLGEPGLDVTKYVITLDTGGDPYIAWLEQLDRWRETYQVEQRGDWFYMHRGDPDLWDVRAKYCAELEGVTYDGGDDGEGEGV